MIEPVLKDEALRQDILASSSEPLLAHLWWLGQSGYLLKWKGRYLLVDPYLSDSLTRKYAGTKMEHVRMTARCLSPDRLGFASLALSTHGHTDHFDAETLTAISQSALAQGSRLRLVLSPALIPAAREKLATAPIDLVPLDAGGSLEIDGFSIHAIPSAHVELKQMRRGTIFFLGSSSGSGLLAFTIAGIPCSIPA